MVCCASGFHVMRSGRALGPVLIDLADRRCSFAEIDIPNDDHLTSRCRF